MRRFIFLFLLGFFLLTHAPFVKADELDDVTHQLENLKKIFNDIKKATDTNEATLDNLKKQLGQILLKVEDLGLEINKKENEN